MSNCSEDQAPAVRIDRRSAIGLAMGAGATGLLATPLAAQSPALAVPAARAIEPLAFAHLDGGLPGLSANLLGQHQSANYAGAVRRLIAIRAELDGTDPAALAGYRLNGIKREELIAWNSKTLHEIYFAGLGAPVAPSTRLAQTIERDFGSVARWHSAFAAMGKALGGGSGWVLLSWSLADNRLANIWASDHSLGLATGVPLLALDMYEHAYAIDYGPRATAYVDAYMQAIDWRAASTRFDRLLSVDTLLG